MEIDITDLYALMCQKDNMLQEYHVVDNSKLKGHSRACFYDWTEIILEVYNYGGERYKIIGVYIDSVAEPQLDENMSGVQHIYSYLVSNVV